MNGNVRKLCGFMEKLSREKLWDQVAARMTHGEHLFGLTEMGSNGNISRSQIRGTKSTAEEDSGGERELLHTSPTHLSQFPAR